MAAAIASHGRHVVTGVSPRFSIVIPAHNASAYISQTIESVTSQSETNWNLIVVDDGSTDATLEILGRFGDPRVLVITQSNQGVSAARNTGLAACRGDYVFLLDADDLLFPDTLKRLGAELDAHPEAVLSYGTCTRFVSKPSATGRPPIRLRRKTNGEALASLLARNSLITGAVLVRREALGRTSGFDRELTIGEDWAFWCDLAALGPVRFVGHRPVLAYRFHPESAMRKLAANPRALWPTIDHIFARDAVRQRFSERERARLRRHAEASALSAAASELVRGHDWQRASRILWELLARDPLSFCLDGISFGLEAASSCLRRITALGPGRSDSGRWGSRCVCH